MADPSTEMNTSTTSNITFAASPNPKTQDDTLALLQLELVDQIQVYKEQQSKSPTKKHKKKAYRSGKGDIALQDIMSLTPDQQMNVLLEHHRLTGQVEPGDHDSDDDYSMMPPLIQDKSEEQQVSTMSSSSQLDARVRLPPKRYRKCNVCKAEDLEQFY